MYSIKALLPNIKNDNVGFSKNLNEMILMQNGTIFSKCFLV